MAPGGWRLESKRGDRWGQRGWEAGGDLRWRGRGRGRGDGGVAGGMVRGHLHQTDRLVEGIYNRGALVSVLGQYDFPPLLLPQNLQRTLDTHVCLAPVEPRRNQGQRFAVCHIWADTRQGGGKGHRRGNEWK